MSHIWLRKVDYYYLEVDVACIVSPSGKDVEIITPCDPQGMDIFIERMAGRDSRSSGKRSLPHLPSQLPGSQGLLHPAG